MISYTESDELWGQVKLIPADDNSDQAGDFGYCPGEESLDRGKPRIEWRAALCERQCGKDYE